MKRTKKTALTVLSIVYLVLLFAVIAAAAVFSAWGYRMHREAVSKASPTELAITIRNGDFTPISELPEFYLEAVICTEDRRFYEHGGVDLRAIARALLHDLRTLSLEQGGSTITQQRASTSTKRRASFRNMSALCSRESRRLRAPTPLSKVRGSPNAAPSRS